LEPARELHEESLSLQRQRGDDTGAALSLSGLGAGYLLTQQPERALECFTEALALRRKLGERLYIGTTLNGIANAYVEMGRLDEALPNVKEALRLQESARRPLAICHCLDVLSLHAERLGRSYDALALLSSIQAIRESTGEVLPPREQEDLQRRAQKLRSGLPERDSREAWLSGQTMALDDAMALGFAYLEKAGDGSPGDSAPQSVR
jgi:tetratricopeptide (TPR) repeat protein